MIAVIDSRMPSMAQSALKSLGYSLCPLPPHPDLDEPVSGHPDMLVFFSHGAILCTKEYATIAKNEFKMLSAYTGLPIVQVKNSVQKHYPDDILLNAASVGKHLFCLPSHTASEILDTERYQIIPVRQGYAKCSTLPVGTNALITEDPSIAKAAKIQGLDVLRISSGAVTLQGYSTGFLGGASSYAPYQSIDSVLFCGDLDHHPDAQSIRRFCKKHQKKPRLLGAFPLTDVGTIFLL